MRSTLAFVMAVTLSLSACSESPPARPDDDMSRPNSKNVGPTDLGTGDAAAADSDGQQVEPAEVVEVDISGEPGAYTFDVTVSSPDTGCEQYADWWEVVTEDEELVYRRILAHSHVDEQPFARSGGPVEIEPGDNVYVRVHMNTSGYSPFAVATSPGGASEKIELGDEFGSELETTSPLPMDCAF